MQNSGQPPRRYYCYPASGEVEGPFEIIELAGLLRADHINAETLTLVEGEEQWLPFQDRTEFTFAKEIPMEAVTRHMNEKAEAATTGFHPRKLLVLVWVMAPFFLFLAYRIAMMYLRYETHQHPVVDPSTDATGSP